MKQSAPSMGKDDSHNNDILPVLPPEVWQFILSQLPLPKLGVAATVSKSWYKLIQELSPLLIKRYFPYLATGLNATTTWQLFVKEYQRYQKKFPSFPMDVIWSALEGKVTDIPAIKDKEPSHVKVNLYALSAANGHALPEGVLNEKEPVYGLALFYAAQNGHLKVVKWLLEKAADQILDEGWALFGAARNGHLEVMNALLENATGIGDEDKVRALLGAAQKGRLEVVKGLLEKATEISDNDKGKVLQVAAEKGLEVVKWLLENTTGISDYRKGVALQWAARKGRLEVVEWLLAKATGISDVDKGKALQEARTNKHNEVVAIIEKHLYPSIIFALRKRYWQYIGAAIGIGIGAFYVSIGFTLLNIIIAGLVGRYLAGICFDMRQADLHSAAQKYDSPKKIDAVKDPIEKKALKMGIKAETWRGYFSSFSQYEGYSHRGAFNAGMTFATEKNEEIVNKIKAMKR